MFHIWNKKLIRGVIGIVSLVTAGITLAESPGLGSPALSKSVMSCVSAATKDVPLDNTKAKLYGSTKYQGTAYYLVGIYTKNDPSTWDLIVTLDPKNRCGAPFGNPTGDFMSFEPFVPAEVARPLALQTIKASIQELGSIQAYQKWLLETAAQSNNQLSLTPEEVWAFQQLQIRLPSNIEIVYPNNTKVSPSQ